MRDATTSLDTLPVDAIDSMKGLIRVLSAPSKFRMCIELTCGDKSADAKLEDRAPECINGTCKSCGFAKLWSGGLRPFVAESSGKKLRLDAPDVFSERLRWSNYAYRMKEKKKSKSKQRSRTSKRTLRRKAESTDSCADEDVEWKKEKARKELYLLARSGTIFDFLDELEPHLMKHIPHRSTLSRQKQASIVFERERRPGYASLDIDFAENLDIEEAKQVQSEHWSTNQCTLFMMVLRFLDVNEWDKEQGLLAVSANVTVRGEKAGESRSPGSFWAKVISGPHRKGDAAETYVVEVAPLI